MECLSQLCNAKIAWFAIGIALIVLEFTAPALVCMFFSLGAFIVMIMLFFVPLSLNIQIGIFLIASIISIIVFRKNCFVFFKGHSTEENPKGDLGDDFAGFKVIVETDINPKSTGKVMFRGSSWEAESTDYLHKGETVEITGKKGLILIVKKI